MFTKEKTYYKSYAEIKVCSKISTTNWDDSFNVSWETLAQFFQKFKYKWRPVDLIKRRKFNNKERFLFYNFFNECIYIYDCKVNVDLAKFDFEQYKFDNIFLFKDEILEKKAHYKINFYYDDLLDNEFDECNYDEVSLPFY